MSNSHVGVNNMSIKDLKEWNRFVGAMFSDQSEMYDFTNKNSAAFQHEFYMINRLQSMFKWTGLPESIPPRILELYLQLNGNVAFTRYDGELYIFTGGLGGEPDVYYRPTIYTVANPALNFSKELRIDADCIVMRNDSLMLGMRPLNRRYSAMLTEAELSMRTALINSRIISLITAENDRAKSAADKYIEDICVGKLGVIGSPALLDAIKTQPFSTASNTNMITNLIEAEQYYKASWFNEIGLNANYNMKRESINAGESQLNNDALLPLIDDMLNNRKEGTEKVNAMFGTNISVSFASSWEDNIEEIEAEQNSISDQSESEGGEVDGMQENTN